MFYIRQPQPKSIIPAKIAVVGPPKSGKTTGLYISYSLATMKFLFFLAAKRIIQEIGCVRISLVSLN